MNTGRSNKKPKQVATMACGEIMSTEKRLLPTKTTKKNKKKKKKRNNIDNADDDKEYISSPRCAKTIPIAKLRGRWENHVEITK